MVKREINPLNPGKGSIYDSIPSNSLKRQCWIQLCPFVGLLLFGYFGIQPEVVWMRYFDDALHLKNYLLKLHKSLKKLKEKGKKDGCNLLKMNKKSPYALKHKDLPVFRSLIPQGIIGIHITGLLSGK